MKNVKRVGVLPAVVLAVSYFSGCSRYFSPLTEEERIAVEQAIEYGSAETSLVETLAEAANQEKVFDSSGTTGVEAFQGDLETTLSLLDTYYAEDKIVGFRETDFPEYKEIPAFYAHEDLIAINHDEVQRRKERSMQAIEPKELVHEAGHILYGTHDASLEHPVEVSLTAATVKTIVEYQDYPYLLTFFYDAANIALDDPYTSVTSTIQNWKGQIENENATAEDIYQQIMLFYCPEQERWIEGTTKDTFNNTHYLPTFALSETEFSTALPPSGIYQYQQKIFEEPITQFMEQYLGDGYTLTCPE